jgi:hypothetical protein
LRASKAYIASLGTTSVLIASSLLMLAFVSALVAYKGWPGAGAGGDVPGLQLENRQAPAGAGAAEDEARRGGRERSSRGEHGSRSHRGGGRTAESPRGRTNLPGSDDGPVRQLQRQSGSGDGSAPADVSSPPADSAPSVGAGDVNGTLQGAAGQVTGGTDVAAPLSGPGETVSKLIDELGGVAEGTVSAP